MCILVDIYLNFFVLIYDIFSILKAHPLIDKVESHMVEWDKKFVLRMWSFRVAPPKCTKSYHNAIWVKRMC